MRLEIKKAGINGEGIAFYKRKPVFIEGCFPEEIVEAKLYDEGRHYRGELLKIIKRSKNRVKVACEHQHRCGSCALMPVSYNEQLRIKKQLLEGALYKYTGEDIDVGQIVPSDKQLFYRNKCNLPIVEKDGILINALYASGSNHPVYINHCLIHDLKLEEIRIRVLKVLNKHHYKAYDHHLKQGLRQLVIRGFDKQYQMVLVSGKDIIDDKTIDDLKRIDGLISIYQGINIHKNPVSMMPENLQLLYGEKKIQFRLGRYRLRLSPQAFFQLNEDQAEKIYEEVRGLVSDNCENLVEAYCGIGAISLYLSDKARHITGIEIVERAIKDAKDNAKLNNIDNVTFITDDAPKAIRRILKQQDIDVLVVDPPRTGLDDELLLSIMKSKIRKIIYVSCNPATLAKNLDVLTNKYHLEMIRGFDMFPNTPHVETVVLLSSKLSEDQVSSYREI